MVESSPSPLQDPRPGGELLPAQAQARLGGDEPWAPYWLWLFPTPGATGFVRWKQLSTGVSVARRLWEARERLRAQALSSGCQAALVYHPAVFQPVCLGCLWLAPASASPLAALRSARSHEASSGLGHPGCDLDSPVLFDNDPDRPFAGLLPSALRQLPSQPGLV